MSIDPVYGGGMTFDRDGAPWLYASPREGCADGADACLFRVDPQTAEATEVGGQSPYVSGPAATRSTVDATTLTPTAGIFQGTLDTVDTATGERVVLGSLLASLMTRGLDVADDGTLCTVGVLPGFDGAAVATLDPATGQAGDLVDIEAPEPLAEVYGLAISRLTCEGPAPAPVVIEPTFTG